METKHPTALATRSFNVVVVTLALLTLLIVWFWLKQSRHQRDTATLTMDQITAQAKQIAPENRAEWLRLARAALQAENVQAMSAPSEPLSNRSHPVVTELGYQLFFDPILSGDQRTACATCHHPEFGLADGLRKGVGMGGAGFGKQRAGTGRELTRNTPSVFNVAYSSSFFWDARAGSLEEQVFAPLFSPHEMNQTNIDGLLGRLRAVPEYRTQFAKAFGANSAADGGDITLPNIAKALAAFERKLNITDTAYDRFVAGQNDLLTLEQLRGMVVFFGQGQCNVCHVAPLFHDDAVSATGVPAEKTKGAPLDADVGFGAVLRRADGIAKFKTPGLRNVARTAPYMHNGIFDTLEEVITFYNDGGGLGLGLKVDGQDFRVTKLDLNEQQQRDLVAFLKSLNDLAPPPVVPARVPSGLPVAGAPLL